MEFEQIIQLIQTVSDSHLTQFCLETDGCSIKMKTDKESRVVSVSPAAVPVSAIPAGAFPAAVAEEAAPDNGNAVVSPLVGTFYNAKTPEAEPFVKVGDRVKKGQVIGIVEAMKLMNEIESEFDGVVREILVENEQMVEYGQPLLVIA